MVVYTLYIKSINNGVSSEEIFRLYVPRDLVLELLKENHDLPSAAHLGIEKTFEKLSRLYYWPKMFESVREYIKNCHACKSSKAPNYSTRPQI